MKKKCSVYGNGHMYDSEGHYHACKCGKRIMYDELTKRWFTFENGQWVEDEQQ